MMRKENYIKVLFKHHAFENESYESAWVKIDNGNYILDNLLFYAKEYSLGDIISINKIGDEFFVSSLIKESGHSTLRLFINSEDGVENVRNELKMMGCPSEISNLKNLISVDVPKNIDYQKIIDFLEDGEQKGIWEYEEACISTNHQNRW